MMKLSERMPLANLVEIIEYPEGNDTYQEYLELIEQAKQLEAELETYRERHRDAKDNFATIQRLREENQRLREAISDFITEPVKSRDTYYALRDALKEGE